MVLGQIVGRIGSAGRRIRGIRPSPGCCIKPGARVPEVIGQPNAVRGVARSLCLFTLSRIGPTGVVGTPGVVKRRTRLGIGGVAGRVWRRGVVVSGEGGCDRLPSASPAVLAARHLRRSGCNRLKAARESASIHVKHRCKVACDGRAGVRWGCWISIGSPAVTWFTRPTAPVAGGSCRRTGHSLTGFIAWSRSVKCGNWLSSDESGAGSLRARECGRGPVEGWGDALVANWERDPDRRWSRRHSSVQVSQRSSLLTREPHLKRGTAWSRRGAVTAQRQLGRRAGDSGSSIPGERPR